jgi:hypothetical protein
MRRRQGGKIVVVGMLNLMLVLADPVSQAEQFADDDGAGRKRRWQGRKPACGWPGARDGSATELRSSQLR